MKTINDLNDTAVLNAKLYFICYRPIVVVHATLFLLLLVHVYYCSGVKIREAVEMWILSIRNILVLFPFKL